jgi:hypothetical protein
LLPGPVVRPSVIAYLMCTAGRLPGGRRNRVRFRGSRGATLGSADHARVLSSELHPGVHAQLGEHASKTAVDGMR